MTDVDLAIPQNLLAYLADGPFASTEAVPVFGPGGGSNFTFRLVLRDPYNGRKSAIVKHGKSHVPRARQIAFDLQRQFFETEALRKVKAILPVNAFVSVPDVYLFDDKAHIIVMEDIIDIASTCAVTNIKELLLNTDPSSALTEASIRTIGTGLGVFLSALHNWGAVLSQQAMLDMFEGNKQGREIYAWANYDRLLSTLTSPDATRTPALTDPPLPFSPAELEGLERVKEDLAALVRTARDTLLHGDFWPGNVLVRTRTAEDGALVVDKLFVVDWEAVRPGCPGFDIGQFLAELYQAQSLGAPEVGARVEALRSTFLQTYKEGRGSDADLDRVASVAMSHMGAHLVGWTPRVWTWAEKEKIRAVVRDGVDFLLNGSSPEAVGKTPLSILTS